ncbi:MAG: helix-turn-helix domain-containing protein [Actinomycetota bacterium]
MEAEGRSGEAVRRAPTPQPIADLLDLFCRRWSLRILWELRDGGSMTSRALRAACGGVSAGVLQQRLDELRAADIVTVNGGYRLTPEGLDLLARMAPLEEWAEAWARRRD